MYPKKKSYPKFLWLLNFTITFLFDKPKANFHLIIMESMYILKIFNLFHSWVKSNIMLKLKDILKGKDDDSFVW